MSEFVQREKSKSSSHYVVKRRTERMKLCGNEKLVVITCDSVQVRDFPQLSFVRSKNVPHFC